MDDCYVQSCKDLDEHHHHQELYVLSIKAGSIPVSSSRYVCRSAFLPHHLGFLPEKKSVLNNDFNILSKLDCSIVFFISAKKINKAIYHFKKYFFDRDILVCKEISKYFEEYFRNSVKNLNEFQKNLKGEITVVISEKKYLKQDIKKLTESDKKKIKILIKKLSIKDIINIFVDEKNVSKKEIYNYCLFLKNEN